MENEEFKPEMLTFVRALVRPKVLEAIELAEKGELTYDTKFCGEITMLEHLGFLKPTLEYGDFKIFVLTRKGKKLKKLLMDLALLAYDSKEGKKDG